MVACSLLLLPLAFSFFLCPTLYSFSLRPALICPFLLTYPTAPSPSTSSLSWRLSCTFICCYLLRLLSSLSAALFCCFLILLLSSCCLLWLPLPPVASVSVACPAHFPPSPFTTFSFLFSLLSSFCTSSSFYSLHMLPTPGSSLITSFYYYLSLPSLSAAFSLSQMPLPPLAAVFSFHYPLLFSPPLLSTSSCFSLPFPHPFFIYPTL